MDYARLYADHARSLAVFRDAVVSWPGEAVLDAGGSIVAPGVQASRDALVQVDRCTDAQRREAGYSAIDVRLIIPAHGFADAIAFGCTVSIADGPNAGDYAVQSVDGDPARVAFDCRARRL